ncbi:nitroreductase [Candidatus Heimdallarchaeota archaeon B3_Heim]|nr:MAG: nitroreductase [Candidatus Heimdallarchaeota archaeon B3_Heim]
MNETLRLLENRRSLRSYDSRPLTSEEKDIIIHCAMRAPTAGNMMHYTMIEVADQTKKDKLVQTCDNQPFIAKAPFVLLFLADLHRWYDLFQYSNVADYCQNHEEEYMTPQESDLLLACCDALIAAENAVIAAEALNIGSCYIGDIMENIEIHREMFNLPKWVFPITLLCFGHPKRDRTSSKKSSRFPKEFVYFKDQYNLRSNQEFERMLLDHYHIKEGKFLKDAQNIGQHVYLRKTGSDFAAEMRRSVKVALKDWLKAD